MEGNVVGHRMARPNIDIAAPVLSGEDQVEVVILHILRVGKVHHFAHCVAPAACF